MCLGIPSLALVSRDPPVLSLGSSRGFESMYGLCTLSHAVCTLPLLTQICAEQLFQIHLKHVRIMMGAHWPFLGFRHSQWGLLIIRFYSHRSMQSDQTVFLKDPQHRGTSVAKNSRGKRGGHGGGG